MEMLRRTDSICPDPKADLLKYVKENNIYEIRRIINQNPGLLSEIFGDPYNKPILYIACKDEAKYVNSNTIDTLIECGADLYYNDNKWQGKEALHFATLGNNPEILKRIIKNVRDINATTKNGNTALHILIKEGNPQDSNFDECASILLQNRIDFNKTDNKNAPPIYFAAKKKIFSLIEILLKYPVDLDSYTSLGKTSRILLTDLNYNVDNIINTAHQAINDDDLLIKFLKESNEISFINVASELEQISDGNHEKTYLQMACEKNMIRGVNILLAKGIDPNRITNKNMQSPLFIAASNGFDQIFEQLIQHRSITVSNDVLHEILRKLDYESQESNHQRCYHLLMDSNISTININSKDKRGNYPLHYGARYGGASVAQGLLKRKASLANKNKFGSLTITDVDYETLKEHFDSCITAKPSDKLDKENMTLHFDYQTLIPTRQLIAGKGDEENKAVLESKNYLVPETDTVLYISRSTELKPLLKHPLLTSFLYMKWQKMRWIFYGNLIFYLAFCLSLLCFAWSNYYSGPGPTFWYACLLVMTLLLIIRELFQIIVSFKKYLVNFENYLEIALIIVVVWMLLINNPSDKAKTQLCAIVFLLVAFELLFLLGNYPDLSTNIVMLRTVSKNFFKFFLFYSILILAFAFCFHTLFHNVKANNSTASTENENESENENEQDFFVNPFVSIFKTVIMLTGEFEAGEIEFNQYPVTSHLIFLTFVVTIAVILLNLLNGLAVSDTQEIKNEAELVVHIARAQYVAYAESMIFSKLLPRRIVNLYYSLFQCREKSKIDKIHPLAKQFCLFPYYLENDELVVYPNQNGLVHFSIDSSKCKCCKTYLNKKIVRQAILLIQEKNEANTKRQAKEDRYEMQRKLYVKVEELLQIMKNK